MRWRPPWAPVSSIRRTRFAGIKPRASLPRRASRCTQTAIICRYSAPGGVSGCSIRSSVPQFGQLLTLDEPLDGAEGFAEDRRDEIQDEAAHDPRDPQPHFVVAGD